jgi:hypothetical protein
MPLLHHTHYLLDDMRSRLRVVLLVLCAALLASFRCCQTIGVEHCVGDNIVDVYSHALLNPCCPAVRRSAVDPWHCLDVALLATPPCSHTPAAPACRTTSKKNPATTPLLALAVLSRAARTIAPRLVPARREQPRRQSVQPRRLHVSLRRVCTASSHHADSSNN